MGDLYPATVENLFSGHAFPVMQAQQELEASIQLALEASTPTRSSLCARSSNSSS